MRIGNFLLVILNLPLVGVWVQLLKIPYRGDPALFFTRPISLAFMIATVLILAIMIAPALRRNRGTS